MVFAPHDRLQHLWVKWRVSHKYSIGRPTAQVEATLTIVTEIGFPQPAESAVCGPFNGVQSPIGGPLKTVFGEKVGGQDAGDQRSQT